MKTTTFERLVSAITGNPVTSSLSPAQAHACVRTLMEQLELHADEATGVVFDPKIAPPDAPFSPPHPEQQNVRWLGGRKRR
jgi:hypothetical protein